MQKQTKKTIIWSVLGVVAILIIVLAVYAVDLATFPGTIKET